MSSPEPTVIRALLARQTGWVSGGDLAKKLGVTRVAVWQYIEKLRAAGFGIETMDRLQILSKFHPCKVTL